MSMLQILQQLVLCQVYFTYPSYQIILILILAQVNVQQPAPTNYYETFLAG